jgi:hypothetical protein
MFMWMLHDGVLNKTASHYQVWKCVTWCSKQDCFSLSSFENVYVNGPECYMLLLILSSLKMFMWMLHGVRNKTASHCQVLKMFMWMLHVASLSSLKFENVYVNVTCCFSFSQVWKCLCECYMLLLILSSSQNVYVNVTQCSIQVCKSASHSQVLKIFM